VVLAVSELVTNAVRHGRPPVFFVLADHRHEVRLDVHDGNPREPAGPSRADDDPDAESGRGMNIVDALAVQVDCEQVPDDGKVIHASFSTARP
jgi:anti-sigma regulatory factor (Ser/Thr protein kinase)